MQNMPMVSTALIVFLVATVGSVVGAVAVCAYFYQEERRNKRQIRPEDQIATMVEPFDTKKLWDRGKKTPISTTPAPEEIGEMKESVNPSSNPTPPPTVPKNEVV